MRQLCSDVGTAREDGASMTKYVPFVFLLGGCMVGEETPPQTSTTQSISWEEFRVRTSADFADQTWEHLSRSLYASIEKARTRLGFTPAYEPEAAVLDAVRWMIDQGELDVATALTT